MADIYTEKVGAAHAAANEIAEIIMMGRVRQRESAQILDDVWTAASNWTADEPLSIAPPLLVEEATAFMRDATWTYAKTMPTNPHWYAVETKIDDPRVESLLELLRGYSSLRRWKGHPYRAIDVDGWSVWDLWPVVNRKPTRYAGWDGDPDPPTDWLPDDLRRDLAGDERWWR